MGSGTIRLSVALTIVAGGLGWFGLKRVSPDGYQQLDVAVVDLVLVAGAFNIWSRNGRSTGPAP